MALGWIPVGPRFLPLPAHRSTMVRRITTDEGEAYRCEECGQVFQAESDAEAHEADCFVPPSM